MNSYTPRQSKKQHSKLSFSLFNELFCMKTYFFSSYVLQSKKIYNTIIKFYVNEIPENIIIVSFDFCNVFRRISPEECIQILRNLLFQTDLPPPSTPYPENFNHRGHNSSRHNKIELL